MQKFTFDLQLDAAITVDAPDADTARKWLVEALDCADTNFGAYPNGDPILGEVSLNGERNIKLAMIDGEDVPDRKHLVAPDALTDRTMFDLLCENLQAWEGEEDSVKEEHAELIDGTEAFIDAARPRFYPPADPDVVADQRAKAAAFAKGWRHGGDGDGFIYDSNVFDSWKEALSWAGEDDAPSEAMASSTIYSTWRECCAGEDIEYVGGEA